MTGFEISFKNTQIYDSLFQKFFMTFIIISEESNYQFVFFSHAHFSKLYMHYIYMYRISYFDLIVGSSVLKCYKESFIKIFIINFGKLCFIYIYIYIFFNGGLLTNDSLNNH